MKYRDISIMFGLPPVLGVLRLGADRVADLFIGHVSSLMSYDIVHNLVSLLVRFL